MIDASVSMTLSFESGYGIYSGAVANNHLWRWEIIRQESWGPSLSCSTETGSIKNVVLEDFPQKIPLCVLEIYLYSGDESGLSAPTFLMLYSRSFGRPVTLPTVTCCGNVSNESIISLKLSLSTVIKGLCLMKFVAPFMIKATIKESSDPLVIIFLGPGAYLVWY